MAKATALPTKPHSAFHALEGLPPLVRRQRRLEGKLAPLKTTIEQEKAVRGDIDVLLIRAGFLKGQTATCAGYDVTHNERNGQTSINETMLVEHFVALGVKRDHAVAALTQATEHGDPSTFATVKPSKGAKVRA